jgi:glycosyltransferase involved in cell wall biosynthesis
MVAGAAAAVVGPESPLTIAVLIPARRAAGTVGAAVRSAQQRGVSAILVRVDGDDDHDTFVAAIASGATVCAGPHVGAAMGRNALAQACAHEWLLFLDADDQLTPGAAERLLHGARRSSDVAVYGEASIVDERGAIRPGRAPIWAPRPDGDVLRVLMTDNFISTTGACLVRRQAFLDVGGFPDLPRAHDWALWCRLATRGTFARVALPAVVVHRRHEGTITSRFGATQQAALAAVDAVFNDPIIRGRCTAERERARLYRRRRARALGTVGAECLQQGRYAEARAALLRAVGAAPHPRDAALLLCAALEVLPAAIRTRLK